MKSMVLVVVFLKALVFLLIGHFPKEVHIFIDRFTMEDIPSERTLLAQVRQVEHIVLLRCCISCYCILFSYEIRIIIFLLCSG